MYLHSDWISCVGEWDVEEFLNAQDLRARLQKFSDKRGLFDQDKIGACSEIDLPKNTIERCLVGR